MNRPRIAHVLNSIGLGGVPEAAFHLIRALPPAAYDNRVYVLKRAAGDEDAREGRAARFADVGVPVAFPARDDAKLGGVGELAAWLAQERIDLLHTHSYKPNLYGRLAGLLCRHTGLKMIAHYHNQYDNKWEKDGGLIYDQTLAHASDALIACSDSVGRHVAERIGVPIERIDVILNGVEGERFAGADRNQARAALGLPADAPVIGCVGRISEQKGQEELIRAAALVRREFPSAVFLVVGSADDEKLLARMQALVAELDLGATVRFTGHLGDMPAVYAALDILAAPSRWEGFGLMLAEAMAAGRPIVAARAGAIPEVVVEDETALLVPPRDAPALAAALLRVLRDPALARRLGAAGVVRARDFSWERSGAALDTVYQRVLTPSPARGGG
jgi:glycosyltransferase involved in cell wall biosynthesis